MARSIRAGVWVVVLAALLAAPAATGARGTEAPHGAPVAPAPGGDAGDGSRPLDVASLDPIEECASVAPRVEKVRPPPEIRASEDYRAPRRGVRRALPPPTPRPRSDCADVARWCLAHATSTSTP